MDTSEPELTHELWRSGEVQEKRAQIRRLILHLSEDYIREKERKESEKNALNLKEKEIKGNEREGTDLEKKAEEVLPPKPLEAPSHTGVKLNQPPEPPAKRRKQPHPTRMVASDSKVIEIE